MATRMNENLVFRCPPDLRVAIEAVAGPRGVSNAIRSAVTEYVERRRKNDDKRPSHSTNRTAVAA